MDVYSVGMLKLLKDVRSKHHAVEEYHRGLGESLDGVIAQLEQGIESGVGRLLGGDVPSAVGLGGSDADMDLGFPKSGFNAFVGPLLGAGGVRIVSEYGDLMYDPATVRGIRKMPAGLDALCEKYGDLDITEVAKLFLATGISRAKTGSPEQKVKTVTSSLYAMVRG